MNNRIFTIIFFIGILVVFVTTCKHVDNRLPESLSKSKECPHFTEQVDSGQLIYPDEANNSCVSCHKGIEPIRDPESGMMQEIYSLASEAGYKDNDCIVCHGGNPNTTDELNAHSGSIDFFENNNGPDTYYPNPASVWINDKTCGMCHQEQVRTQFTSLMFTEAGKIQGTTWGFGGIQGYNHDVANIAVNPTCIFRFITY